jgi:GH15 family glucan-1,4-alpha-glucosidase
MTADIGDYALIGDCETAALISSSGSIDWLCWPRFDSDACMAALLGDASCGSWTMGPRAPVLRRERRYRRDTLIVETFMATQTGAVRLIDFMPLRGSLSDLVRIVVGESGEVEMQTAVTLRFDYGRLRPWLRGLDHHRIEIISGPHAVLVQGDTELAITDGRCTSHFVMKAGQRASFVARYRPSHMRTPRHCDAEKALHATEQFWRDWASQCTYVGPWRDAVVRALITLKALFYRPTGGIVAAVTTSLTESPDVPRNWDYRYCWLRDSTFALLALIHGGYLKEALTWRDWLLRTVAGMPEKLQPVYGAAGEPSIPERKLPWLPGPSNRHMVHVGNAAARQLQIDGFGEVVDALHQARGYEIKPTQTGLQTEAALVEQIEKIWNHPDHGIWEMRNDPQHFVHSKVMAWAALDRAILDGRQHQRDWPFERWRCLRNTIHADVCARGFDTQIGAFVQSYERRIPDASTLLIPMVGFLPASDPRVVGTLKAVERHLTKRDFVYRYDSSQVPGERREGAFLACSFWLVDNLLLQGDHARAEAMFERLIKIGNDVGLLAEEYDPDSGRFRGNFPQALSHLSLANTAFNLARRGGPMHDRYRRSQAGFDSDGASLRSGDA